MHELWCDRAAFLHRNVGIIQWPLNVCEVRPYRVINLAFLFTGTVQQVIGMAQIGSTTKEGVLSVSHSG